MSNNHSHDHDHDHSHPHEHPPASDDGPAPRESRLLEKALRELLIEKGVLTAEMIHRRMDMMDSRNPALGAKVVARSWVDPNFRRELIAEPLKTIEAFTGTPMLVAGSPELRVVENEADVHNIVVCTLCSCYPRMLLGIPPAWYKAPEYRSRVVREPRAVLAEFGVDLPGSTEVRVHDSTADVRYLVIPQRPPGTDGWPEEQLAALISRDAMIGAALVKT